jgi:hypothetical protein
MLVVSSNLYFYPLHLYFSFINLTILKQRQTRLDENLDFI